MHSLIREYCKHIKKKQLEVLRLDKRKGVWFWDLPACATICHDGKYKKRSRGYSHRPKGTKWHAKLRADLISKLGEIGKHSRYCPYIIGNCAEQHAANNYMNKYKVNKMNLFYFTETVRPRTMEIIPSCKNCKTLFPNL